MDEERGCASPRDRTDEIAHECVILDGVDADAMLDGHRQRDRVAYRRHTGGNQRRLSHQARAEAPSLHTLGRAADVEIDLVVAPGFAQSRAMRQRLRVATAQLQRDRVLG